MIGWLKKNIITDKSFYKEWMKLAVPISLQALIVVGVNVADTFMLSRLSESQISAASLAGSYMSLITILSMGIGFGANVMASQYWGADDKDNFRKTAALVVRISIIAGIIISAFTIAFAPQIMRLYTNDAEVVSYGSEYLTYIGAALFFQVLSQPLSYVVRSAGKTNIALFSSLWAFLLNIAINYVFIFGKFGAPRMEIAGAALGTLISYIFQFFYIWISVFGCSRELGLKLFDFLRPIGGLGKVFAKYSLPVILSDLMVGLGINMASVIVGHIGSYYVAAEAVVSTLMRLLQSFSNGMANSAAVVVGHSIGKKQEDYAYRQGVSCTVFSAVFGLFLSFIVLIFGKTYVNLYNLSGQSLQAAYSMIYAASITTMFMIVSSVLTKGVLRGGGDTKFLLVCESVFQWFVSLPLGALAGLVFKWPVFWIYLCIYSERIIRSFAAFIRLCGHKWIRSVS